MKEITIDSAFPRMLLEGAQSQDLDFEPILLRNGISRLTLAKPGTRVRLESFAAFAIEIMRELNDEFLGLAARSQPLGSFNMMCRSCISARDINHSFRRCANYWSLFQNSFEHRIEEDKDTMAYVLSPIDGKPSLNNYLVEALLSTIHRFHCWLGGQFIPLNLISLNHAQPDYNDEYRALFYMAHQ